LFCEIHPYKPATQLIIRNNQQVWLCDNCANKCRSCYKVWNIANDVDCAELIALVLAGELT
jgi:hypothetical protein